LRFVCKSVIKVYKLTLHMEGYICAMN